MNKLESQFAAARRSEPYLDDAGFTFAVMAALPRSNELPLWVKNMILLVATALGSAIVVWQLPPVIFLGDKAASIATNFEFIAMAAMAVYTISLGVVWAARNEIV